MADCLFCKIVAGEISAARVYENATVVSFLDINPVNFGHTLVVPKTHYRNIFDAPEAALCALMAAAKKIAPAVKNAVSGDGVNLIMNNERAAGQIIDHTHLHIVPRFADDGFRHWEGRRKYADGEAEKMAANIKTRL
jgi:histidine triad (HIT) family protein